MYILVLSKILLLTIFSQILLNLHPIFVQSIMAQREPYCPLHKIVLLRKIYSDSAAHRPLECIGEFFATIAPIKINCGFVHDTVNQNHCSNFVAGWASEKVIICIDLIFKWNASALNSSRRSYFNRFNCVVHAIQRMSINKRKCCDGSSFRSTLQRHNGKNELEKNHQIYSCLISSSVFILYHYHNIYYISHPWRE